ncbi:hypothetical protein ECAE60S_03488 [Eoetvoesiella caeni]
MLPETDAKGAALIAECCHEAIKHFAIPDVHSSISDRLTASRGVCTWCRPLTMISSASSIE